MNNKKYYFIIDMINLLLKFLISFSVVGIILAPITKDPAMVFKAFILLPAPVISYFTGRYLKHLWSFLILHILLGIAYFLMSTNLFTQVIYVIYIIILTIMELNAQLQPERLKKINTSIFFIPVFFLMYMVNSYIGLTELNQLSFILAIAFVLLYLLNMYLINFESYFQNHSSVSNIPMGQIVSTNNTLIVFFCGFCIFVMLLFTRLPLNSILSVISKMILAIIRTIVSLFLTDGDNTNAEDIMGSEINENQQLFEDAGTASPILEFIFNLILGLILLVVIGAFIALIVYGIYKLYQHFHADKINNFKDHTEFISPFDKRTKVERDYKNVFTRKSSHFWGRTNNEKIRKMFYKAALSGEADIEHPELLTPVRLSQLILSKDQGIINSTADSKKVAELTACYEKARYSKEECSKDEVLLVKELLK